MFTEREGDDCEDVISWLREQPWCSGTVGMIGKSWSGYSALQAATRDPDSLKAIIMVCSSDDRYTTALHYTGGALLVDSVWWSTSMLLLNSLPPDPEVAGEDWRTTWRMRLEGNEPMLPDWLDHQHRDDYWLEGSLASKLGDIKSAVYLVGGWADYLSRAIPRLLSNIDAPRRALVGPWGHHYPHDGTPGPAIGFLQDSVRWWDRWLKEVDNGIDKEPMVRVWMQDSVEPQTDYAERPGRWVAERQWPSVRIKPRRWILNAGTLDRRARAETALTYRSPQSVGLCAMEWLSAGVPGELPRDQREDDGRSLTFDTKPLTEQIEILGEAVAVLELALDRPVAHVVARICDVAPDGSSARVSFGVLNLAHRDGHERPTALRPGQRYRVEMCLPATAYSFPRGHRIRLALSTAYWPIIWPSPEDPLLTLFTGVSEIVLPVRRPDALDSSLTPFGPPERGPAVRVTRLAEATTQRSIERDPQSGQTTITLRTGNNLLPFGHYRIDAIDTEMAHTFNKTLVIADDDPLSARVDIAESIQLGRDGWRVSVDARTVATCDRTHFHVESSAHATLNGDKISSKHWQSRHQRNLL
jgi:putative CocE/NonD family hydrolase